MSEGADTRASVLREGSTRATAALRAVWDDPRFLSVRTPAVAGLAVVAIGLLWHALLPPLPQYQGFNAVLMGPLPDAVGVSLGLYAHRADRWWMRALAAVAWGSIAGFVLLIGLGLFLFGVWPTLGGVYGNLAVAFAYPFAGAPYLTDRAMAAPALWSIVKAMMTWAAFAYAGVMCWRYDGLGIAFPLLSRYGINRAFGREQRRIRLAWQRDYMAAVRAGQPPPPPPPELMVRGGARSLGHTLHSAFWIGRIVLLIAGAIGFWTAFDDQIKALFRQLGYGLFMRQLFGG